MLITTGITTREYFGSSGLKPEIVELICGTEVNCSAYVVCDVVYMVDDAGSYLVDDAGNYIIE